MKVFSWRFAVAVAPLLLVSNGCSRPASPSPASQSQGVRSETTPVNEETPSQPKRSGHLDVHVGQGGVEVDIERRPTSATADAPK